MDYTCKPLKVGLFDNRKTRYTMAQVKKATGADIVFNGSLFNWSDYSPCCDIRIGGKILNDDEWGYYGYGWNDNELPKVMHSKDMFSVDNYLSCIWAIHNGEKQTLNDKQSGIGGVRGRTAFGFKADGTMVIIVTSDKSGAMSLSQVRDALFNKGCVNGIILDGGGSSQIDTPDEDIYSSRIVSNFLCVWIDKVGDKKDPVVITKEDDTLNIIQPNYKWAYGATLRKKTDYIVLHHVGAVGNFTPEQIHAEHLRKGWRGIGYNFYVRKDGTIYHGREESAAGGHTLNYNQVSIGICFEGNFEVEKMPLVQREAGQALIAYLKPKYPTAKIVRHSQLNATACPGNNFPFADITNVPAPTTAQITGKAYRVTIPQTQIGVFADKARADALAAEYIKKGIKLIITEVKI